MLMELDTSQKAAIASLKAKLVAAAVSEEPLGGPPGVMIEDEFSNTFGVLGPRGAGKSTILRCLYNEYRPAKPELEFQHGLVVLRPFDCSLVGSDLAPGTAILLHLEREIRSILKERQRGGDERTRQSLDELGRLAGQYSQTTETFRQLGAEISSSLHEYTAFTLTGMRERMSLRERLPLLVRECLAELGRDLRKGENAARAFVVLLDDFDLVHAREVRKWILALLDELHQRRLLIVVTADFYRLEHLSWDPDAEFDDKTGRAVLDKLLPSPNRVNLTRWLSDSRRAFKIGSAEGRELEMEVSRFGVESPVQEILLKRLLPGWPRGLVNLSRSLQALPGSSSLMEDSLKEFVSLLASCRGEPLLARELKAKPISFWPRFLLFPDVTSPEDWLEAVEVAEERLAVRDGGEPPLQIKPVKLLLPQVGKISRTVGKKNDSEESQSTEPTSSEPESRGSELEDDLERGYDPLRHDPAWGDPLRHDYLRVQPLRDSQDRVQPFWSELLLNYGFLEKVVDAPAEAVRNRLYFLDRWQPAVSKARRAEFRIRCDRESLRRFFEVEDLPWAALLWMSWELGREPIASIGWYPLVSALRGSRDVFQAEQMGDLLIDLRSLRGELPEIGKGEELRFVPDHVWSMILLIDSLDRCPWKLFSRPLGWRISTYVLLASVFVRSAYVYALSRCGALEDLSLSIEQEIFVQALRRRSPVNLLKLEEEGMVNQCRVILLDSFEERVKDRGNSLAAAAAAFFESTVYKGIKEMFAEVRET